MNTRADKSSNTKSQAQANDPSHRKVENSLALTFEDNRSETLQLTKLQEIANNSPRVSYASAIQRMADDSSISRSLPVQRMNLKDFEAAFTDPPESTTKEEPKYKPDLNLFSADHKLRKEQDERERAKVDEKRQIENARLLDLNRKDRHTAVGQDNANNDKHKSLTSQINASRVLIANSGMPKAKWEALFRTEIGSLTLPALDTVWDKVKVLDMEARQLNEAALRKKSEDEDPEVVGYSTKNYVDTLKRKYAEVNNGKAPPANMPVESILEEIGFRSRDTVLAVWKKSIADKYPELIAERLPSWLETILKKDQGISTEKLDELVEKDLKSLDSKLSVL